MKTRLRIRHNMQPSDRTVGWKNGKPVIRLYTAQVEIAQKLGIPLQEYGKRFFLAYQANRRGESV